MISEKDLNELRAGHRRLFDLLCRVLEYDYRRGSKGAVLRLMALCMHQGVEIPNWARDAFIDACFSSATRSWDDVFGPRFPKGKSLIKQRRRETVMKKVYVRMAELRAQGQPVDDGLFSQVGKQLGVSAGTVRAIYYDKGGKLAWNFGDNVEKLERFVERAKREQTSKK